MKKFAGFKNLLKSIAIITFSIIFLLLCVEGLSLIWLWVNAGISHKNSVLVSRFPSQFRLDPKLIQYATGSKLQSNTESRDYEFDPMLGILNKNYLTLYVDGIHIPYDGQGWWDKVADKYGKRMWIVALGGSTTASAQATNWPAHIASELLGRGLHMESIAVLNAGHNGFSLSQEFAYFTYRIYPQIVNHQINLKTILTLDGVNDISFNLPALINNDLQGPNFNPLYNGYLNVIENNFAEQFKGDGQVNTLFRVVAYYSNYFLNRWLPITSTVFYSNKNPMPEELLAYVGEYKRINLFRFNAFYVGIPQSLGPVNIDDFYNLPDSVIYSESFSGLLDSIDMNLTTEKLAIQRNHVVLKSKSIIRDFSAIPYIKLSDNISEVLVKSVSSHLNNFDNFFKGARLSSFHFLQPIRYSVDVIDSTLNKDIPSFDYILAHWAMRRSALGLPYAFNSKLLYGQLSTVYKNNLPNRFDISNIFDSSTYDKANMYTYDNIHYTNIGSKIIAKTIVEKCYALNRCGLN